MGMIVSGGARRPVVEIIGQGGTDLAGRWSGALISVRFTDNEGGEADEIEMEFSVNPPFPAPPAKGTRFIFRYGWAGGARRNAGLFTFQNARLTPSPGNGWTMAITARSADFVDADKSAGSEHFDDMTAGDIFKKLAGGAGKSAIVHPSIANIEIPYRARLAQSAIGAAQALAEDVGASLKPADGRWLVTAKNSGQTASGTPIPPIIIHADAVMDGSDLNAEERPRHGEVKAAWFDPDQGRAVQETAAGQGGKALFTGLHVAASAGEAARRSLADSTELTRSLITGSVVVEGDVSAMAGAPVTLAGFGGWSESGLVAASISHEFTFNESGGWLMTIECVSKG